MLLTSRIRALINRTLIIRLPITCIGRLLRRFLLDRLLKDAKLRKIARSSDPQVFKDSHFPRFFEETAQEAYMESTERFTKMFEDKAKYMAIMNAVGAAIYRECRNNTKVK